MKQLILFSVSIFPIILLGKWIYDKDKEKEPFELLAKLFLAGMGSCFITIVLTYILGSIFPFFTLEIKNLNIVTLIPYVFIGVALIEEFSKWIVAYIISYNDSEFNQIYDAIVYTTFVALGFAFFENLLYVYKGGVSTGIARSVLAVPGHLCDGIFMGYYLGLAKQAKTNNNKKLETKNKLFSLIIPVVLHGVYDYCLFTENQIFLLLFFCFLSFLFYQARNKIRQFVSLGNITIKNQYCINCGSKLEGKYCTNCGKEK